MTKNRIIQLAKQIAAGKSVVATPEEIAEAQAMVEVAKRFAESHCHRGSVGYPVGVPAPRRVE